MKCPLRLVVVFTFVLFSSFKSQASVITVTSSADSGRGTLRQAITTANGNGTVDTIKFNIPTTGGAPATIALLSELPDITESLTIDGTSQPGSKANTNATGALNTVINVVLDGTDAGGVEGVVIDRVNNCVIKGLNVRGFTNGIVIRGDAQNNKIEGNFVGTDETGKIDRGNSGAGVFIDSIYVGTVKKDRGITAADNNIVGGSTAASRNLISGNDGDGIEVLVADNEIIEGNLIGTEVTGSTNLGNSGNGILLDTATNCQIGSSGVLGNVISGNGGNGVSVTNSSTGNKIQGNRIGTSSSGLLALANVGAGVLVSSGSNTIGGTAASLGNVISGNGSGIKISSASNSVLSNLIGVGSDGSKALGNTGSDGGIRVTGRSATNNQIGAAGQGNVISDNSLAGISIDTSANGTVIRGNTIGLAKDGTTLAPNSNGIDVAGVSNCVIGGTNAGEGNLISGNKAAGVQLRAGATSVTLNGNKIGTDSAGSIAKANFWGVVINSIAGVTVGGNTASARNLISGNQFGVYIQGSSATGNTVSGNYIGTNAAGTGSVANTSSGVRIDTGAHNNVIGGATAAAGNVISGNTALGIDVEGSGTNSNSIQGNRIGSNAAGTAALPNGSFGVILFNGPQSNTIGGATSTPGTAPGNLLGGNTSGEVVVSASGTDNNVILGNLIGTNAAGTAALKSNTISGSGVIILDGASRTVVGGNAATARNIISGSDAGVMIAASPLATVSGNYIGTTVTGLAALPNRVGVLLLNQSSQAIIGGTTSTAGVAPGNVISGNTEDGIHFGGGSAGTDANDSSVLGNIVGLDKNGAKKLANGQLGIGITDNSSTVIIGGTDTTERNVISGNGSNGIFIDGASAAGNQVQGNYIGTDLNGTTALGNGKSGVFVSARGSNNVIGGNLSAARNLISGNARNGVELQSTSTKVTVQNNYIGTDVTGNSALKNTQNGIQITDCTGMLIGGHTSWANVISGNGGDGVTITESGGTNHADSNLIQGNLIGLGADATTGVPNAGNGVAVSGHSNTVGGISAGLRNSIKQNTGDGVEVISGDGNAVRGNNIAFNGKLGLDLLASGESLGTVTANDGLDADSGPNNLTNFPTIQSAIQNGSSVAVKYSIQGAPNTTYDVDFFSSSSADASGFGEGETYLTSTNGLLKTDSTGASNTLTTNITGSFNGKVITMTATDGSGNTSEFGSAVSVADAPATYTVNSTADTDDGACTTGTGGCTLREAINAANTHAGSDTIKFNIPGTGVQTITLNSGLAPITDPVTIDGYSQSGSSVNTLTSGDNAKLMIQIQGTSGADTGFVTTAPNCTFRGLVINNFSKSHIIFIGNTVLNSKVVGCFLGTNATGTAAGAIPASFSMVIQEGASSNAVGSPAVADRNIISGNSCGINLFSGATANTIENNYVGVDATGTKAIPNSSCGLLLAASPEETVIGGTTSASRNIISGNGTGISIDNQGTDNNLVQGNYIGVDVTGTKSIPNTTVGIEITSEAQGNVVGGSTSNLANIICGSPIGINLDGNNAFNTTNNTVAGNFIGTNTSFATGLGNTYGVRVTGGANGNLIGGTAAGAGNFISGNTQIGISIDGAGSSNNTVAGNLIGVSSNGAAVGNGSFGLGISISAGASGNTIGGTVAGSRNIISGHTDGTGVKITDAGSDNNTVAGNYVGVSISGTAALGNNRGVVMANGAKNNTVGGLTAAARNVISGCEFAVGMSDAGTTGNKAQGNYLGTNAAGTAVIANRFGVGVGGGASQNTIGGTASGAGNLISGNTDGNVYFSGAVNNTVAGNFIGTNATGTASMGNFTTSASVVITDGSTGNIIGGTTSASRNIISGAAGHGVEIQGSTTGTAPFSTGNTVTGNYIGTDVTGTKAVPNGEIGVFIFAGASANTIGGTVPSVGNLISGNGSSGILLKDAGTKSNIISGNVIGLDATGSQALGNVEDGITVTSGATNTTIGGLSAGQRNVISANGTGTAGRGIQLEGSNTSSNTVIGNYIGTDATGTVALGNSREGVYCNDSPNNTIGGNTAGSRNIISGNGTFDTGSAGVAIIGTNATGNTVQSNYIGINAAGLAAIRNVREGVYVNGSNNRILSNIIGGNGLEGVRVATLFGDFTTGNAIKGNVIGVDINGTKALPNATGILVDGTATKTTIGGPALEDRNLISGNTGNGVQLDTNSNTLQGNFIGTTANGRAALANGGSGVLVRGSNNMVGGNTAALRNIISGNAQNNVGINGTLGNSPSGNKVQGNYIGLDFPGTAIVGGGRPGVAIGQGAHNNTIGGSGTGEGNVISGCQAGVSILNPGTDSNVVQGNRIGTDPNGTVVLGNTVMGVEIVDGARNNVIGGGSSIPGSGAGNVISGNQAEGIVIGDPGTSGNRVQGNVIGTSSSGGLNLGNGAAGISVENGATGNVIGGVSSGLSNVISFNAGDGVNVSGASSTGNPIRTNRFNSNTGLPVNLQPSGESANKQTANDAGDTDTGPNLLQNFPVLSSASVSGSSVVLTVTLNSAASKKFDVDLYKVNAAGTGPFIFRATQNVTTNSAGNVTFSFTTAGASGDIFAAMATDSSGNSSEISPAFTVSGGTPLPLSLTMASPVQEGNTAAYSGTVSRGSASTASALSVSLVANPAGQLNLPVTVTIPADSKSANFQFFVVNDSVFEPESQPVKVTASATNFISATAVVDVLDDDSSGGQVFGWGYNEFGQVGNGGTTDRSIAVAVGLTNVRSVAANGSHSLAVLADGSVRSWGYNGAGQLGDGTQTNRSKPVTVAGLANVQEVAAGWYHSLALKSDGTVWAWGYNSNGQLGDGTTTRRPKPVQVQGLTNIKAISAGVYYSLALKNDGTVWAWGSNFYGQLGDGTKTDRHVPVQVNIPAVVTAISAGGGHSLFLKGNGTVWSCGWNNYGQLGQGSTTDGSTPVKLNGISGCTGISAGYAHSVAVTGDGSVFGWGDNSYGQIGAKVKGNTATATQINALSGIAGIEAGADFSVFVRTGGTVQTLGGNGHGQLGNGVVGTNSSSPANVLNLTSVGRAGAGYGHVLAIGEATGGALKPLGPSQRNF